MEENNKMSEITAEAEDNGGELHPVHYTKQQNIFYTIVSIGLFFVLYFALKGITAAASRPYYILADISAIGEEQVLDAFDISGVSKEQGYSLYSARLDKSNGRYVLQTVFSGISDGEIFAESGITFEYGDAEEDIRIEFCPDPENPGYIEYVYAEKFVDIEAPSRELYLFGWDGELYAEYREYSGTVSAEVSAIFSGHEKVYTDF